VADNVGYTPGTGAIVAADDVSGVLHQRVKLDKGADGVSSPVTDANPFPVQITDGTDVVSVVQLGTTITSTDEGLVTNSIIHGLSTAGGGSYVDVKVSPSGAVQVGGSVDIASSALPADAATETTLAAINTKTLTPQTGIASYSDTYTPVAQLPAHSLRIGFDRVYSNAVDTAQVTLLQTGSGQTVNQAGGSLVITTGTTANAETIIRSLETVEASFVMRFSTLLSQRIANQNFIIELVDVIGDALSYTLNSATSMTITIPSNPFTAANVGQGFWVSTNTLITAASQRVTIASVSGSNVTVTGAGWPASGSGLCDVFGWNYHQLTFTGTTATNMNFDAQRNGWASGVTTATINTTASTTVPTYAVADGEAVVFDQTGASATGLETTQRGSRVRNVPGSSVPLYLQIRCLNGTTAPASTTTWTVGFVDVQHCATAPVTLQNVSPMSSNTGLPVNLVGSITQSVTLTANTPTLAAGTNRAGFVAGAGIWYDDSSTTLTAGTSFTGTSRDLTVTATATAFANAATYAKEIRVSAESDVPGALWIEVSRDNTNFRRAKYVPTTAITGGGYFAEIIMRPSWRYARVGYTNGATGQARFTIGTFLMAI